MRCEQCGKQVGKTASFCDSCGSAVVQSSQQYSDISAKPASDIEPAKPESSRNRRFLWFAACLMLVWMIMSSGSIFGWQIMQGKCGPENASQCLFVDTKWIPTFYKFWG